MFTAWSIAADEADPAVFRAAMDRTITDAAGVRDSLRGRAEVIFGLSSLSGILLDELAQASGRSRGEVLHAVHRRCLDPGGLSQPWPKLPPRWAFPGSARDELARHIGGMRHHSAP
ncbi:MAG TPA: hypothetical protein VJ757_06475 [Pseudonocardiaceae bacterium]|nr:hypothetical protein [Pseudonocardiaceae bacterium]